MGSSDSRKNLIFFGVLALVLVLYVYVLRPLNRGSEGLNHKSVGADLPSFSLDPLDEAGEKLDSTQLAGKVALINFWATWCGPCQQEFPHMVEMAKEFGSRPDFRMVSIRSPGGGETEDDMREATEAYLQVREVDMPVYLDPYNNAYQAIVSTIRVQHGIPLTLVADRKGVVRGIWVGYRPGSEEEIQSLIQDLLGDKASKKDNAA